MSESFKTKPDIENEEEKDIPSGEDERAKIRKDDMPGHATISRRAKVRESTSAREGYAKKGDKLGLDISGLSNKQAARIVNLLEAITDIRDKKRRYFEIIKSKELSVGDRVTLEDKETEYTIKSITDQGRVSLEKINLVVSPARLTKVSIEKKE